jgi:hypothetical protein
MLWRKSLNGRGDVHNAHCSLNRSLFIPIFDWLIVLLLLYIVCSFSLLIAGRAAYVILPHPPQIGLDIWKGDIAGLGKHPLP